MTLLKSKSEIGLYIKDKIKKLGISQSDLAGEIAKLKGDGYDKNSIKDNVSKWIRGERYPGTEYIFYIAQVLKVSIEEILVAGEVCEKYDNRPYTLYAIAKSGNREMVDKVMSMQNGWGGSVGTNYDEYDNTLLDYIIEFENLDLLHYLIEKGYVFFSGNQIVTTIRVGNTYSELFSQIVSLAIKHDDLFLFQSAVMRTMPVLLSKKDCAGFNSFIKGEFRNGYELDYADVVGILNTDKILEYLITPFVPSLEEWRQLNAGIVYRRIGSREEQIEVKEVETLIASFNLLLNIAVKEKLPGAKKISDIGAEHNKKAKWQIEKIYSPNDYEIGSEGNVTVGYGIGSLTIFAGIIADYYDEQLFKGLIKL